MTSPTRPSGLLADLPEALALRVAGARAGAGTGTVTGAGARVLSYEDLLDTLCHGLGQLGVPVWRAFLGVETLHPIDSGRTVTWSAGEITTRRRARLDRAKSHDYANSPVRIVDETRKPLRIRLGGTGADDDSPGADMPTVADLRSAGGTDYVIHPLPFVDDTRTAVISFATQAPDGFSPGDLDRLAAATAIISPHIERLAIREIAINLLDTYVGPRSGQRVFEGLIERGDLITLPAAIVFADLRDYTSLSERLPGPVTVSLLDAWFDTLGGPIEANGGEILKFLGDGLLAVFPGGDAPGAACRAALDAALEADRDFARVPAAAGLGPGEVGFGIGLHYGELAYGNVGTRRRLDFTVIGPAVNLASRLQDLSKSMPETVLASADFAALVDGHVGGPTGGHAGGGDGDPVTGGLIPHGRHALRGIAAPVDVFTVGPARSR